MSSGFAAGRERNQQSFTDYKPQRIEPEEIDKLLGCHADLRVVDEYESLLEELFRIEHPSVHPKNVGYHEQLKNYREIHYGGQSADKAGSWFYYPWRGAVVHVLPTELHARVRSNRNLDLITQEEQKKLREITIGVVGLSVGSNVLTALSLMGQYKRIKIADSDELSLSNMNRLYASITDLNVPKTTLAARGIYERDPEANVSIFAEGLNARNLNDFLDGVDIVFDEIDDVAMKAQLRLAARDLRLPVIMMTDVGDSGILDIERYDLDPTQQLFHGRLSEAEVNELLGSSPDPGKWLELVAKIIGLEHVPSRLLQSLPKIGRELVGAPQLGTAAMVSGGIGAYVARMVALGTPLRTGKIPLVVEANILKDYQREEDLRRELLGRMTARGNT